MDPTHEHIQIDDCEQDQPRSFKMSLDNNIRLKYDDEAAQDSDIGELQSDLEEDEQEPNRPTEQQVTTALKQEFDIESLASSSGSTISPAPPPEAQHTIAPGANSYEKKQTFLAAQLAEPNEGTSHFSNQLNNCQFHMDRESIEKLHDQQQQRRQQANNMKPHASHKTHKSTNQRQQHEMSNSQNNNIDYDEHVKHVDLFGVKIVALTINSKERLCLAQISNTLLKNFSYNEIHNRRVALGITCVQCTPIQLEMLRRAGAMPSSSRRCGMITMREAERLCRSFLAEEQPPELPENFYFTVGHRVNYGCKGRFIPSRYISSRAKCIECFHCGEFYSPNKFIFHSHKQPDATDCNPPDSPNINSWRKHINLDWTLEHSQEIKYAWEDVKSLFNGGTRRRTSATSAGSVPPMINGACSATSAPRAEQAIGGGGGGGGSSPLSCAAPRKNPQKLSLAVDDGQVQPVDADIARLAGQQSQLAPMSQSERRKLPMSSWPRICAAQAAPGHYSRDQSQSPTPVKRPLTGQNQFPGGQQQQQQQQPLKKAALASQWPPHPTMHNQRSSASYSTEQHSGGTLYGQTAQRSPMSGAGSGGGGCAPSPQKHARTTSKQQPHPLAPQTSASILSNTIAGNQHHHHHHQQQHQHHQRPNLGAAYSAHQQHDTAVPSSFIYSQLYSQLMQSQLNQQQQAATNLAVSQQQHQQPHQSRQPQIPSTLDAQLALRHHIWSSLLANIRCNPSAFDATNLQAELATSAGQAQNSSSLLSPSCLAAGANLQTNNLAGMTHDLSNQSPPSNVSTLNPLYGLLPPMRLYAGGSPAGHVGSANGLTTLFNSGTSDSCK